MDCNDSESNLIFEVHILYLNPDLHQNWKQLETRV